MSTAVHTVAVLPDMHGMLPLLDAVLSKPGATAGDTVTSSGPRLPGGDG